MHQRVAKAGRRKTRKSTAKKGGYYSFSGALATGAPGWTQKSEMADWSLSNRGGNAQYGRGRKKTGKKSKKTRKVKRGGIRFGQAVAGYTGTGDRGLANYPDVSLPGGKAASGEFANHGAQPGSGYGSFITTSK